MSVIRVAIKGLKKKAPDKFGSLFLQVWEL